MMIDDTNCSYKSSEVFINHSTMKEEVVLSFIVLGSYGWSFLIIRVENIISRTDSLDG
jgi:hypothetical protein